MKPSLSAFFVVLAPVALLFQGCITGGASNRAQERSAVFGQLDPATQKHLMNGNVERGYTKDMVYIAIGNPSKVETRATPDGPVEIWVYKNMVLPQSGGFRGITYNTNFQIGPGENLGPGAQQVGNVRTAAAGYSSKSGTQTDNAVNQGAMDSATELPDLPTGTLYLFFFGDRVYKMTLGS